MYCMQAHSFGRPSKAQRQTSSFTRRHKLCLRRGAQRMIWSTSYSRSSSGMTASMSLHGSVWRRHVRYGPWIGAQSTQRSFRLPPRAYIMLLSGTQRAICESSPTRNAVGLRGCSRRLRVPMELSLSRRHRPTYTNATQTCSRARRAVCRMVGTKRYILRHGYISMKSGRSWSFTMASQPASLDYSTLRPKLRSCLVIAR